MSNNEAPIIKLESSDGELFQVPVDVAVLSKLLRSSILPDENEEDDEIDNEEIDFSNTDALNLQEDAIVIQNVTSQVLEKVIEFCKHHVHTDEKMPEIKVPLKGETLETNVPQWYVDFCNVDFDTLQDLVTAANYMNIPRLLDMACLAVAFQIKGLNKREMADKFGVDFAEVEAAEEELKAAMNREEAPAPVVNG